MGAVAAATELVPIPTHGPAIHRHQPVRWATPTRRAEFDSTVWRVTFRTSPTTTPSTAGSPTPSPGSCGAPSSPSISVPLLGENLSLTTFCSGTGRSWAERRTSISGDRGGSVEAVSLWVQVDAATDRIRALGDEFHQIYGDAAGGRRVSARLSLPGPADRRHHEPTVADPRGRSRRPRSRQQRCTMGDPRGSARRRSRRIGTESPRSSTLHRSTPPTRRQR